MTHNAQCFWKGMGAGAIAGMTMYAMGSMAISKNKNGLKKKVGKAVKAVGNFMDDVQLSLIHI